MKREKFTDEERRSVVDAAMHCLRTGAIEGLMLLPQGPISAGGGLWCGWDELIKSIQCTVLSSPTGSCRVGVSRQLEINLIDGVSIGLPWWWKTTRECTEVVTITQEMLQ